MGRALDSLGSAGTQEALARLATAGLASAAPAAREPEADNVRPIKTQRKSSSSESYWQALAERQAVEILRLQARIAELEQRR